MTSFTTFGPRYMGDLATVFYRDAGGTVIPVLDIVQGQGRAVDQETASRLADNIVSVLNDQNPAQPLAMQGLRVKWTRNSRGFHILFQQGPDLSHVMGALAMFNDACPPSLVGAASDKLAEQQGLAHVLSKVNMIGTIPHIDRGRTPAAP